MSNEVIKFIKEKEYKYIKDLGHGSFGKTVLIKDDELDTMYACKKYSPTFDAGTKYFDKFIGEIKILNSMLNENIVRIYNSYIYREQKAGYIIMEYVDGTDIESYIKINPKEIDSIFVQLISAFSYLEKKNICHRDIRAKNMLVNSNGVVKIIDFGFGKEFTLDSKVSDSTQNNNWICSLPDEMCVAEPKYNNMTDMYFLGNLIKQIVDDIGITFKYSFIIKKMIQKNPENRYKSFNEISKILNEKSVTDLFVVNDEEKIIYKDFIDSLVNIVEKIASSASIRKEINEIIDMLIEMCNRNVFEDYINDNKELVDCFINGKCLYNEFECQFDSYEGEEYYVHAMSVEVVQKFINWISNCDDVEKKMVFDNIVYKLNKIETYLDIEDVDELPF